MYQSKTQPTHHKLTGVQSKLTIAGSEELRNTEIKSKYLCLLKISEVEWSVIRDSSTFKELEKMFVPIFNRTYTVKLFQETQLHYSCSYSDVWGLPCEHTICVATSLKPHWIGLSHHDVSVCWLESYYLYSLPTPIIYESEK